jgi:hypothetical protein
VFLIIINTFEIHYPIPMKKILLLLTASVTILMGCQKINDELLEPKQSHSENGVLKTLNPFMEDMELGTKTAYTTANISLSTGSWTFNNALIGTSTSDKKNGTKSARIQSTGKLTLLTDKLNGAGTVSVTHAAYGTDASSTWQLWYSTNAGSSYTQAGSTITSVAGSLATATFNLNVSGNVRFEIRKISGGTARINIDDISISDFGTTPPPPTPTTGKKFLFDAKHGQTFGNADWVIDQDNSVISQNPTPAQSNVTSSTSETFWTGGISAWGIALAKLGHTVHSMPSSVSITYGNTANAQDLSLYDVFIVDEPNTLFTTAEKTAMMQYVQNGGSLFIVGNHSGSDRNNDGYDAPAIWNNFFSTNSVAVNPFGFTFDLVNLVQTTSNIAPLTANPILSGSQGAVTSIQYNNGTSMTMNPTANSTVTGLIWSNGVTRNNNNVFCLSSTYGNGGKVVALGDSSPTDDGTGAPGDVLYNGWSALSHSRLLMNASLWLADL